MSAKTSYEPAKSRKDYLQWEINIFKPASQYMKDYLVSMWITFVLWAVAIFGPPTVLRLTQTTPSGIGPLTEATFLGFPLHWFIAALGSTTAALILCLVFTLQLDKLSKRYGSFEDKGEEEKEEIESEKEESTASETTDVH